MSKPHCLPPSKPSQSSSSHHCTPHCASKPPAQNANKQITLHPTSLSSIPSFSPVSFISFSLLLGKCQSSQMATGCISLIQILTFSYFRQDNNCHNHNQMATSMPYHTTLKIPLKSFTDTFGLAHFPYGNLCIP